MIAELGNTKTQRHKDTRAEKGDVALCPHFQYGLKLKMGTQGYVPLFRPCAFVCVCSSYSSSSAFFLVLASFSLAFSARSAFFTSSSLPRSSIMARSAPSPLRLPSLMMRL